MIIHSLTLKNFRQFCGEQTISFSTDESKKATLLIGESGFGKTTLVQAFSWTFYGESKYKDPLNQVIRSELKPNEKAAVSCSVFLTYNKNKYVITRTQEFQKINVRIQPLASVLTIDQKDEKGIDHQFRGQEAIRLIKEMMHKDLFPYFFLEGENLTRIGEQMSKGKSGNNNEFVKAVKGLLGFNYMYEAEKHLNAASEKYLAEVKSHNVDKQLNTLLETISRCDDTIRKCKERLETIGNEIEYNTEQRDKLREEIANYANVEEKQKQSIRLYSDCANLKTQIIEQKKKVLRLFSSDAFNFFLLPLLKQADDALESADAVDKGIPGITVEAVKFMLENHKCICGNELIEGSSEWEHLNDWLKYLPPNNIGYEIKNYKDNVSFMVRAGDRFKNDFADARKRLNELVGEYNLKVDEMARLDAEIKNAPNVSAKKIQEDEYNQKLVELSNEKWCKNQEYIAATSEKQNAEKNQELYRMANEKVKRLSKYQLMASRLSGIIQRFTFKREKEKRLALEKEINNIFKDFYKEEVSFCLDDNYVVQIKTSDQSLLEDFASGGQGVAVALAFIGAIIRLNGTKGQPASTASNDDEDDDLSYEIESEIYPLVMDAPTSNFGMKQMDSFAEIMPKVTNQIIVFINDKDGPILRDRLINIIGKEYKLVQQDTFHANIVEEI